MKNGELQWFLKRAEAAVEQKIKDSSKPFHDRDRKFLLLLNELIKEQLPNEDTRPSARTAR